MGDDAIEHRSGLNCDRSLKVAVVIVSYNSGVYLARCIESIISQRRPPDRVVVIDNDSRDDSPTIALTFGDLVEVHANKTNIGFAAAANQGLRFCLEAHMDLLALINPDAFADPNWLDALVEAANKYPDHGSFASAMLNEADPSFVDGFGDVYHLSGLVWRRFHGRKLRREWLESREVFGACAGAALYRVPSVQDAGGFDEDFFCYVEDVDLAFRLQLIGKPCRFVPAARVKHIGSATLGLRSDFSVFYGTRNLVWTHVKNMPAALLVLSLPFHSLAIFTLLLRVTLRGQGAVALQAIGEAFQGLKKQRRKRQGIHTRRRVSLITLIQALDKRIVPVR